MGSIGAVPTSLPSTRTLLAYMVVGWGLFNFTHATTAPTPASAITMPATMLFDAREKMIENAIASGISARATTRPAMTSVRTVVPWSLSLK